MTSLSKSKLFILGNGFDLMHGMKTRYSDFYAWLIKSGRFDVIEELQSVYKLKNDDKYMLWSDFENALGNYDIDVAVNWSWDNLYLTEFSIAGQEDCSSPSFFLNTQLDDIINDIFPKWVNSIEIAENPVVTLPKESIYLTFNYTDTLEQIYQIPTDNILHIHGRAKNQEHLVVGHDTIINQSDYWDDSIDLRENNERMQRLTDMNDLCKPFNKIIEQNEDFFKKMSGIQEVEIIGHSCGKIDYPYFKKIRNSLPASARWKFNPHTPKDAQQAKDLKEVLNICLY